MKPLLVSLTPLPLLFTANGFAVTLAFAANSAMSFTLLIEQANILEYE
ncbi:exported hypothetical protein [uncultured Citrobacter sp.]|uniref:Uncharacterized protein n=1 Tax=uncultured Citrobacter sp. TaxID=200446 RepID=A0A212IL88_9ENTR|nr:exported hypothetical protein [uncultured Citrobacter sp.]